MERRRVVCRQKAKALLGLKVRLINDLIGRVIFVSIQGAVGCKGQHRLLNEKAQRNGFDLIYCITMEQQLSCNKDRNERNLQGSVTKRLVCWGTVKPLSFTEIIFL